MSVNEFKQQLFDAVLELLWRQWSQLGISGQISTDGTSYVLDPEVLLIFSTRFGRYDQRLYDLILDWLRLNGSAINIQRLKTLAGNCRFKDLPSLGYLAAQMQLADGNRWKKPATDFLPAPVETPVPMFLSPGNGRTNFIRRQDELAAQYGFLRDAYVPSGKVTPYPVDDVPALLLRTRGLFGVSARAETILILLDKGICRIQDIADRTGFAWKSIQDVLTEMIAAGFVAARSGEKRGKYYLLKAPEKVKALLNIENCRFPDWKNLFDALGILWETVSNPRLAALSEATFRSELERVFEESVGNALLCAEFKELQCPDAESLLTLPEILKRI